MTTKRSARVMSFKQYWRSIPQKHPLLQGLSRGERRARIKKWYKAELQRGRLRRKDDPT